MFLSFSFRVINRSSYLQQRYFPRFSLKRWEICQVAKKREKIRKPRKVQLLLKGKEVGELIIKSLTERSVQKITLFRFLTNFIGIFSLAILRSSSSLTESIWMPVLGCGVFSQYKSDIAVRLPWARDQRLSNSQKQKVFFGTTMTILVRVNTVW